MKWERTCLYKVLSEPLGEVKRNNIYYSLLRLPLYALIYTVGVLIAVCIDFYVAINEKP